MKKIIGITFFFIYLFSTTEAYQLLKLPIIFEHFAEHKKESPGITFFQFLDLHYMHGSPHDADYERDMQLPFKTCTHCIAAVAGACVPNTVSYTFEMPVTTTNKPFFFCKDQFLFSSYLSAIWQPPKLC